MTRVGTGWKDDEIEALVADVRTIAKTSATRQRRLSAVSLRMKRRNAL